MVGRKKIRSTALARTIMATAAASLTAAVSVTAAAASPETARPEAMTPSAVRAGPSPWLAAGLAVPALNYGQYGLGMTVRAGVDARRAGTLDQRFGVLGSFTRFQITGATLDLGTVEGSYRLTPFRIPLYVVASAGLLASREAFDVTLARGRRIDNVGFRAGVPLGLGLGLALFRHVDLEASYRHAFFLGDRGPGMFGQATFTAGGRF